MSKQETIERVAEHLREEICAVANAREDEVVRTEVHLNRALNNWEIDVHFADGRVARIPLASAVARHLASPVKRGRAGKAIWIPPELQRQARIEPALRYLGVFGFGIGIQDGRRLREWLYERPASFPDNASSSNAECDNDGDPAEDPEEPGKSGSDPYYPGEIQRCAGVLAAVLCSEADLAGFAERWADFRGEEFQPEKAAEYSRRWHRLSSWNPSEIASEDAFEKHLSTACIGSEKWLTFSALKKQWHGLKLGLIGPAATYSLEGGSEGGQLQIRPVPACQCPICARWDLVKLDNTCGGTPYGHVPQICAYVPKPGRKSGQKDERVFRIVAKDRWAPVLTWKCGKCKRLYFLPDTELHRQRAAAILRVLDPQGDGGAAADSGAVTKDEIARYVAHFRRSRADDQDGMRKQLETHARVPAYACPNCGATGGWAPGAAFWVPLKEHAPREAGEKYAGFQQSVAPNDDEPIGRIDRVDRSAGLDHAPDQVLQRRRGHEAARRLAERVQPGTAEYLIVQANYLDDPPVSLQKQFQALPAGERLRATFRLQDLVRQIETELEEEGWDVDHSDE